MTKHNIEDLSRIYQGFLEGLSRTYLEFTENYFYFGTESEAQFFPKLKTQKKNPAILHCMKYPFSLPPPPQYIWKGPMTLPM